MLYRLRPDFDYSKSSMESLENERNYFLKAIELHKEIGAHRHAIIMKQSLAIVNVEIEYRKLNKGDNK
jgi:hypothetical protein